MNNELGKLYIVATPIGNLEDITFRAVRILNEVDIVLCEDTRHSSILFKRYEIKTKTESFHAQSNDSKLEKISGYLEKGLNVALVSDAGTPLISDPGSNLLFFLRKKFKNEIEIIAIPGPSALTAALSIIPVPSGHFIFSGFVPQKKGRQTLLKEMESSKDTYVCYESSHRILKLMEELTEFNPNSYVYLARELTKQFEEVLEGTPHELSKVLKEDTNKQKGEFVVVITKMLK